MSTTNNILNKYFKNKKICSSGSQLTERHVAGFWEFWIKHVGVLALKVLVVVLSLPEAVNEPLVEIDPDNIHFRSVSGSQESYIQVNAPFLIQIKVFPIS